MNIWQIIALAALAALFVSVCGFIALIEWIGRGEPDVNGDPERDAGLTTTNGGTRS